MGFFSDRRGDRDKAGDSPDDASALPPSLSQEFSTPGGADLGIGTPPLTRDRIVSFLVKEESPYFIDSDGDVGWISTGRIFYFFLLGKESEILQIRGMWGRQAAMDYLPQIIEFCNNWNMERFWPKAYVRVRDDGVVLVNTEVSTDLEHGVSDDQLMQLVRCGLATGSMFFNELDQKFPDPIAPPRS